MTLLIAGLAIFFAVHLARVVAPGWRERLLAANPGRWKGLYALASLVGFALVVWGWIIWRPEAPQLYVPPAWGRHVAMLLVPLGLICLAAAYQPAGWIRATLQHPFLVGVMLWALAHLLANGDLAGVLVFGSFLAYGVVDIVAALGRPARLAFATWRGDVVAVTAGLALTAALLLGLHQILFGVSPLAG
jgi:uncharacterized membrane protein